MRSRITRAILLVTGLVVISLGVPLAVVVEKFYEDRAVIELQGQAAENISELALPLRSADISGAAGETDEPSRFSVYDPAGRLIYGDGPESADAPALAALRGESVSDHVAHDLVVATPITDRGSEEIVGAMRVTQPEGVVAGEARRAWLLMLVVVVAAFAGAVLVARRQAQRLSAPIARLADQAEGLGRGDLAAPVAPSGIAEVDTVATALDSSAARLADLLARERAFSADVSHQLRTPLAGLRLRLERALRDNELGAIPGAIAEVDRIGDTVEHLLALARDMHSDSATLAVDALMRSIDERWRPHFTAAGRTLVTQADARVPETRASAVSIGQVLDVLIDNALRHGRGPVGVRARAAAGGLVLEVQDAGPGIPPDRLQSIFDRRDGVDHGIGLALARTITEAEGGRLLAVGGRPPCFHLILPASG